MSSMSGSRATGLVRNVSMPMLAFGAPGSPETSRVPRVSSFSTMAKPSLMAAYRDRDRSRDGLSASDDEADGMVPQLEQFDHEPRDVAGEEVRREQLEDVTDSDSGEDVPDRIHRELEDVTSDSDKRLFAMTAVSAPPSVIYASMSRRRSATSLLGRVRAMIAAAVSWLRVFVPPCRMPDATGSPDAELKFLFLAAMSMMLFPFSALLAYKLSTAWELQVICLLILAVPFVARQTADVYLPTALLMFDVMAYAVTGARVTSPVILVWASMVPVIAFATLGNRCGLASSGATAACIFAVDFSDRRGVEDGMASMIIAMWVLFLGCVGVVQTQIRAVTLGDHEACVRAKGGGEVCEMYGGSGRGGGGGELGFVAPDAVVPDAVHSSRVHTHSFG